MKLDNENQILLKPQLFVKSATGRGTVETLDRQLRQEPKNITAKDKEVMEVMEVIKASGPRTLSKGLQKWNLEDDLIWHRGKIYVPPNDELKRKIVKMYHDSPVTRHPGRWKTYVLVLDNFWWPGMSTFVKEYITGCTTC